MNYGWRFMTLYRRQESRPPPWKRNAKKKSKGVVKPKSSYTGGNIIKWYSYFEEVKTHTIIPSNSTSREMETHLHEQNWTWMLTAALLRILKNWRESKYPSIDEWMNKMWNSPITESLLLSNKKEQTTDTYYNIHKPQKHYAKERYVRQYNFTYVKSFKTAKL